MINQDQLKLATRYVEAQLAFNAKRVELEEAANVRMVALSKFREGVSDLVTQDAPLAIRVDDAVLVVRKDEFGDISLDLITLIESC